MKPLICCIIFTVSFFRRIRYYYLPTFLVLLPSFFTMSTQIPLQKVAILIVLHQLFVVRTSCELEHLPWAAAQNCGRGCSKERFRNTTPPNLLRSFTARNHPRLTTASLRLRTKTSRQRKGERKRNHTLRPSEVFAFLFEFCRQLDGFNVQVHAYLCGCFSKSLYRLVASCFLIQLQRHSFTSRCCHRDFRLFKRFCGLKPPDFEAPSSTDSGTCL